MLEQVFTDRVDSALNPHLRIIIIIINIIIISVVVVVDATAAAVVHSLLFCSTEIKANWIENKESQPIRMWGKNHIRKKSNSSGCDEIIY